VPNKKIGKHGFAESLVVVCCMLWVALGKEGESGSIMNVLGACSRRPIIGVLE